MFSFLSRKRYLGDFAIGKTRAARSISKAREVAGSGSGGFVFAVTRRRLGLKLAEKTLGRGSDFVDRFGKSRLVGFRWLVEPTDLPHKLQGGIAHFIRRGGRVKVEEHFDIAAHGDPRLMIAEKQGTREQGSKEAMEQVSESAAEGWGNAEEGC